MIDNKEQFAQSLVGKSPTEIVRIISNEDQGEVAQSLNESQTFQDYCQSQIYALLEARLAMREEDARNFDVFITHTNKPLTKSQIELAFKICQENLYIHAPKYIDFDKNNIFQKFASNLAFFDTELKEKQNSVLDEKRIAERQKLVDFSLYLAGGKKSLELIEKNNWKAIENEWNAFPKMPLPFIQSLQKKNQEGKQNSNRDAFLTRLFLYRLTDICGGRFQPSTEEITYLEENIDKLDLSSELREKLQQRLQDIKQAEENKKQQQAEEQKHKKPTVIHLTEEQEDNKQNSSIQPSKNEEQPQKHSTQISLEEQKDSRSEVQEKIPLTASETEEKNPTFAPDTNWLETSRKDWQEWGKQNNKIVKEYNNEYPNGLAFKIFENEEKLKAGKYEVDVSLRQQDDIVVKMPEGKIPSESFFKQLVIQAKKNGPEIELGEIKNPEFKARLMLACLEDPEVVLINPPKLSELGHIPPDVASRLEKKLTPKPRIEQAQQRLKDFNKEKRDNQSKHQSSLNQGEKRSMPSRNKNYERKSRERQESSYSHKDFNER